MKIKRNKQSRARLFENAEAFKDKSGKANVPCDETRSVTQKRETIEEFFERLGIPIKNVTDELAGRTDIISINRNRTKE